MPRRKPETREQRTQRLLDDRPKAWAEYEGERQAVAERTARLKALRLAKEASESGEAPALETPKKLKRKARRPFAQGRG